MMYGDTAHDGSVYWLTRGAAQIPAWRNTLAMALAFPGIILYGIALHLFYIMILYAFSWFPLVSEILMLPPFLYWFYLQIRQKTVFPKGMAFTNILVIYFLMYGIKSMMPDCPFRIGFTNGLMSESMIIWFGIMLAWNLCRKRGTGK